MTSSPADADGLRAARDPAGVARAADAWCERRGVTPPDSWERTYGRHAPGRHPWAVLVVEARPRRPGSPLVLCVSFGDPEAPEVRPFSEDPALPGLASILAELSDVEVLRYRPGMRCTMRARIGGRAVIVKVAPAAATAGVDAQELWNAHLAGRLPFAVAEPLGWDSATGTLLQAVVPGGSLLDEVLGPEGPTLSRRLGVALAGLARSGVTPAQDAHPGEQPDRTDRAVARAAARVPALEARLRAVAEALRRAGESLPAAPRMPCHGAPHVHQWLIDGNRLGLIDFDRFAMGEPELDVATYVAELETERGIVRGADVHEAAMVEGFAAGGVTLDPRRVRLYRRHKRIAKITRTAIALRPDAAERAGALLAALEADLELGPSPV